MTELMAKGLEYAQNDEFYKVLECARHMDPPDYAEFFEIIVNLKKNPDFIDKMGKTLSFEDMHEFLSLGSSKRIAEYIVKKAENEELTDEEMDELKAAVL